MIKPENTEPALLVEDVGGEFGFRISWKIKPHWADFTVYEITSREADKPMFNRKDWQSLPDPVETIEEAEPYLTGFVKWDGCCEFHDVNTHFCGPDGLIKHFALLKFLYVRAGDLSGHKHAELPWPQPKRD